jgi:hypothetical protein
LIAPTYEELAGFHKPIMVSEIGTVTQGGDAAEWVSETMRRLQAAYTQVKAVVWFSYRYSLRADFRLRGRSAVALWAALGSSYWRGGAALEGRGTGAGSGGRSRSGSASTSIRSTQSSASK